jgi:deoxyribonuclease V
VNDRAKAIRHAATYVLSAALVESEESETGRGSLCCVDVDYRRDGGAVAACVSFSGWTADRPDRIWRVRIDHVAPYEPGSLFRRELPCILAVLQEAGRKFETIVVDAYVTLDPSGAPGLGARLYEALDGASVVGVAKTRFAPATTAIPVMRGKSTRPLWVTSMGIEPRRAAEAVENMHGAARIPTLLRLVDREARSA